MDDFPFAVDPAHLSGTGIPAKGNRSVPLSGTLRVSRPSQLVMCDIFESSDVELMRFRSE